MSSNLKQNLKLIDDSAKEIETNMLFKTTKIKNS